MLLWLRSSNMANLSDYQTDFTTVRTRRQCQADSTHGRHDQSALESEATDSSRLPSTFPYRLGSPTNVLQLTFDSSAIKQEDTETHPSPARDQTRLRIFAEKTETFNDFSAPAVLKTEEAVQMSPLVQPKDAEIVDSNTVRSSEDNDQNIKPRDVLAGRKFLLAPDVAQDDVFRDRIHSNGGSVVTSQWTHLTSQHRIGRHFIVIGDQFGLLPNVCKKNIMFDAEVRQGILVPMSVVHEAIDNGDTSILDRYRIS